MNHYPHHIGDFDTATRHLTRVERSLYRDLMDLYYGGERALPGVDPEWLQRRVLAHSDEEKQALDRVLSEFFTLENGEYHNARCDREIEKYHSLIETASKAGKASAAKRFNKKATRVQRPLASGSTNQNQNQNHNITTLPGKPGVKKNLEFLPEGFSRFWGVWPPGERKHSKGKCLEVWKRKGCEDLSVRIVAHVESLRTSEGWRSGFVPAPLVYLNQARWEGVEPVEKEQRRVAL